MNVIGNNFEVQYFAPFDGVMFVIGSNVEVLYFAPLDGVMLMPSCPKRKVSAVSLVQVSELPAGERVNSEMDP